MGEELVPLAAAAAQTPGVMETMYGHIPWDAILITYFMIFFDLFYGVLVSTVKQEPVSHKMLKGLQNKLFVLFVPVAGVIIKTFFVICSLPAEWSGTNTLVSLFGVSRLSDFPICFLLCLFVILMEFLSFLENSAKISKRAKRLLNVIQRNVDSKNENVKHLISDIDEDDLQTCS